MIQQISQFIEGCPICGRPLAIRYEYLGSPVACEHCGGAFIVTGNGAGAPGLAVLPQSLIEASGRRLAGPSGNSAEAVNQISLMPRRSCSRTPNTVRADTARRNDRGPAFVRIIAQSTVP